jgi:hypothetical protein
MLLVFATKKRLQILKMERIVAIVAAEAALMAVAVAGNSRLSSTHLEVLNAVPWSVQQSHPLFS